MSPKLYQSGNQCIPLGKTVKCSCWLYKGPDQGRIQGWGQGALAPAPAGKSPTFWSNILTIYVKILTIYVKNSNFGREKC